MKPGERPPRGVREIVLRLAGRNPRPTNREVREAVQRKFGEDFELSDRTIVRYCRAAGLPTSGRRSSGLDKETGNPDLEIALHRKELVSFGQRLREGLSIETPYKAAESITEGDPAAMWNGGPAVVLACGPRDAEEETAEAEWGFGRYGVRTQSLFPSFQEHLAGHVCWAALEVVENGFRKYREACQRAYRLVWKEVKRRLPDLPDPEIRKMTESLLTDTYYRVAVP